MEIVNARGRVFGVRVVLRGERYGLNDAVVNDSTESLIEFYDRTYIDGKFGPRGQFVARYSASTLAKVAGGLNLCGHVPEWHIDVDAMASVVALAKLLARPEV